MTAPLAGVALRPCSWRSVFTLELTIQSKRGGENEILEVKNILVTIYLLLPVHFPSRTKGQGSKFTLKAGKNHNIGGEKSVNNQCWGYFTLLWG